MNTEKDNFNWLEEQLIALEEEEEKKESLTANRNSLKNEFLFTKTSIQKESNKQIGK